MAHKSKATSDVNYKPEDPPLAYNNATVHNPLMESKGQRVHIAGKESTIGAPNPLMEKSS